MKNSKNLFLVAGLVLTTVASFAQKANETSAAVEFKSNFQPAFFSQDMPKAKSSLAKAKEYIDLAYANETTKESPKTLYYKGEIYFYIMVMKGIDSNLFSTVTPEVAFEESIAAFNKSYTISNKMDADIEEAIAQKKSLVEMACLASYDAKNYKDAMEGYDAQVKLSSALNQIDTTSIYFAGICAEKAENYGKAAEYYIKCADLSYKVPEMYKTVANVLILDKKNDEATAYLEKAIEKDPNDKAMHYVIGTFYMEAGQNDKATESLRKAIALDPKYQDAQYQLGAHLLSIGLNIRTEANALKPNDPNFDKLIAESDAYYTQALVPLEAYIAMQPNDKEVLLNLSKLYRSLKNTEKALEYKRRHDEVK